MTFLLGLCGLGALVGILVVGIYGGAAIAEGQRIAGLDAREHWWVFAAALSVLAGVLWWSMTHSAWIAFDARIQQRAEARP